MDIRACQVSHLPLITAFAKRLGIVEEIDSRVAGRMATSLGRIALALIHDALSGRSPLFRVHEFFAAKDTELLLGADLDETALGAHTIGRTLDRLHEHGTNKILTAVALRAMKLVNVRETFVHFDTTSLRVWGQHEPLDTDPFNLTWGHSKCKRPDLHQLVLSLLSGKGGLPIQFTCEHGNSSDKKPNRNALQLANEFFSDNRDLPQPVAYSADSTMVTQDNLEAARHAPFVTRLPANYKECGQAIAPACRGERLADRRVPEFDTYLAQTPCSALQGA